jgi:serine/threonine protein kinase
VKAAQLQWFMFAGCWSRSWLQPVPLAEDAITHLKASVPVYRDLAHPNLVKLLHAEAIGAGYACIFEWEQAECMGRRYPASREKFLQMTTETRSQIFEEILNFHLHVIASGYVAIDLYDGSIMYNFDDERTVLCDIDVYAKRPYTNHMGRMWGSTRFMSPEEFKLGATIDEVTNVYTMGAVAYALFANFDRSWEAWPLSRARYQVVQKAVSDDRPERQQSLHQLIEEWQSS